MDDNYKYPETILQEIAEDVHTLASGGGGGGSSLPEVTSADNGNVLTVVEGAWAKAEPLGGVLIANYVYGDDGDYVDETYATLKAAFLAGKTVLLVRDDSYNDPDYGTSQFTYDMARGLEEYANTGAQTEPHTYFTIYFGTAPYTAATPEDYPQATD